MRRFLDRFGRFELDPVNSGIDAATLWGERVSALYDYSVRDREAFLAALAAEVAGDQGGFATFGAARVVWEMLGKDALDTPSAWPLIEAGIAFKQARGLSSLHLTGYEQEHLQRRARLRPPPE
ncbi:hypothetical protein [Dactylosporangium sp. CA-139066]|uniref:hypothetical protein n=1 Tax=Dactylosporangium sp. CA-139066 TaxID=3239930 RepID=UPI003D92FB01